MNGARKSRDEGGGGGENSSFGTSPNPPQADATASAFLAALAAFHSMSGSNNMNPMMTMWQRPPLPSVPFNQGRIPLAAPNFPHPLLLPPPQPASQLPPPPPPPPPTLPQVRPQFPPAELERLIQRQSELRAVQQEVHQQLNENQVMEMLRQSLQNGDISPQLIRRIQELRNPMRGGNAGPVRRKNSTRESTQVLKNWLNSHSHNPYPSKNEKYILSMASDMTLTQVSTWFANARRRLKKERRATWIGPSGLDHLFGEQSSPILPSTASNNYEEIDFEPETTGPQNNRSNGSSTLSESTQGVDDTDVMEKSSEVATLPTARPTTPPKPTTKFWSVADMTAES